MVSNYWYRAASGPPERWVLADPRYVPPSAQHSDVMASVRATPSGHWVALTFNALKVFDDREEAMVWVQTVAVMEGIVK